MHGPTRVFWANLTASSLQAGFIKLKLNMNCLPQGAADRGLRGLT
jgi:hypothetical protein